MEEAIISGIIKSNVIGLVKGSPYKEEAIRAVIDGLCEGMEGEPEWRDTLIAAFQHECDRLEGTRHTP